MSTSAELRRAAHGGEAHDGEGDVSTPTRQASVGGRDVFVFDGLVDAAEINRYFAGMSQASFARTETARPDSQEFRHWVCETPLANLARIAMWPPTEAAVARLRPGEHYQRIAPTPTSPPTATHCSRMSTRCRTRASSPRCGSLRTLGHGLGWRDAVL
jgi:hypothetical protein